jgi:O-antigen/teichoic acid export membrane protein
VREQILALGKDSVIYGVGSVITRFIGLLLLPVFTAYLSPADYGVLAMLAILTMVAHPVFSLGLSASMGPSYFEGTSAQAKAITVWTAFLLNLVSASLLVVIAWSMPTHIGMLVRLSDDYALLVSLTLTGSAVTILVTSLMQRVQFERQAKLYAGIAVIAALSAILASVVTVVCLGWGIRGMVIGQLAGNVVSFLGFAIVGATATRFAVSLSTAKELLRLGLPLVPSFAFLFVLMHANKYILEWESGLDAVGIYSIGFALGTVISIVTSGIATAWYPFFMSFMAQPNEVKTIFGRILTYYVFGVGSLCLGFFLLAKPLVVLLAQEPFHGAYVVVGFVALAHFAQALFNFFLPGLYFTREVKYVAIVQAVAAAASLPIHYVFIRAYGVLGAALGLAIGNLLMAALMLAWNLFNSSRYPRVTYEWRRILTFAVGFVSLLAIYALLPGFNLLGEVAKSSLLGTLFFIALLFQLHDHERILLFDTIRQYCPVGNRKAATG